MKKAKKLIAGIMLACMVIVGAGVKPPDVFAATTTAAAGSLEMKTASDSINLNAGQSFDVTFSVNAETSGFGGYDRRATPEYPQGKKSDQQFL